jgi:CDGSH-type Zn-finger protein
MERCGGGVNCAYWRLRQITTEGEIMSDEQKVKITVKDNASLRIEGNFAIVDVEGNEIPHEGTAVGLCRCGHSANKPFCDGSHKERFESAVRAPKA